MDENQIMMMLRGGAQVNEQAPQQQAQQNYAQLQPMAMPQMMQQGAPQPQGFSIPSAKPSGMESMFQPAATNRPDAVIAGLPTPGESPSWMQSPQDAQKPQAQPAQPAQAKPAAAKPVQWVTKLPPAQVSKHIGDMQNYLSQWGAKLPPEQKAKLMGDLDQFIYQQLTPQERSFYPGLSDQQRHPQWKPIQGAAK